MKVNANGERPACFARCRDFCVQSQLGPHAKSHGGGADSSPRQTLRRCWTRAQGVRCLHSEPFVVYGGMGMIVPSHTTLAAGMACPESG